MHFSSSATLARKWKLWVGMWLGVVLALPGFARAQSDSYIPCLGCAEHQELSSRWQRPFLTQLGAESFVLLDHFHFEAQARALGLCETDALIRTPLGIGGCHQFSWNRALLIETPLELVAFTSPAWGLARRGHPRWGMAVEFLPMSYHLLSTRATVESIHRWQRLQFLLH